MIPVQQRTARTLQFGIYRDGDNNLDASQEDAVAQARKVAANDPRIGFTIEDTHAPAKRDMASPQNLAQFVAQTLDDAQASGAKQTWIELVDHGAGDGGGLEADSFKQIMPMPQMAQAIEEGMKLHAQRHPEDADRKVDGVVANQCLMASLGFADALSHAGVKYLAASPETMVSPGVPSTVAEAIAQHGGDPQAMAKAVVDETMRYHYGEGIFSYTPAAAFDVIDLDRTKMGAVETSVKALNDAIAASGSDAGAMAALRSDAKRNEGMARIPGATPDMPWHADRPAIALYDTIAHDARLSGAISGAAGKAEAAVGSLVLAHRESRDYAPFDGENYADAAGPTVHFPVNAAQVDPWAPRVSETHNRSSTKPTLPRRSAPSRDRRQDGGRLWMEAHEGMSKEPTTGDLLKALLELGEAVGQGFSAVDRRFDRVEATLEAHSQTLNRHERKFDAIDDHLHRIDVRLDGIDVRLDGIDVRLDGIDVRLDGIDVRLDGMDRRFDAMDASMLALQGGLATLTVRVDAIAAA